MDGVSFEVRPGEIYGLLGPNGAGKTTTLSLIAGLLKPESGEIEVEGQPFWADPPRAQRIMGVVPQEVALYEELSGRDNLEFWGRLAGLSAPASRARAAELLAALHLTDRAADPVRRYSGGMKRRINIGCALLHQPRLLLLDEPTVGIDPQARAGILGFIRQLAAGGTAILYTTHYLEEAEDLCHRIGIMDKGRVFAEGTLEELRQRLGGERIFVLDGSWANADPSTWPGFSSQFRVLRKADRQLTVAPTTTRDPAEDLRRLLALPVRIENLTLKQPSLNEVFLQLTGRDLRE